MKLNLPLPVWIVGVLLALCTGVVLGTLAPVPRAAAPPLPAATDGPPAMQSAAVQLPFTGAAPWQEARAIGAEGEYGESELPGGGPVPGWERVGQGPGVIAPGMDTLPAAPLTAVALPYPERAPSASSADRPRSVIRITDAREAPSSSRRTASADRCAGVIRDASGSLPPECRRTSPSRFEAMCPKPGDVDHQGPVLCIRSVEPD